MSKFLLGQTCCDTTGVFMIAEKPATPNITYKQIEETLNTAVPIDHFILPTDNVIKIRFIINCKGETLNYSKLSQLDNELYNEIILTLKSTVSWTPAKQANRNVDIWKILTISSKNGRFKILGERDLKDKKHIK